MLSLPFLLYKKSINRKSYERTKRKIRVYVAHSGQCRAIETARRKAAVGLTGPFISGNRQPFPQITDEIADVLLP